MFNIYMVREVWAFVMDHLYQECPEGTHLKFSCGHILSSTLTEASTFLYLISWIIFPLSSLMHSRFKQRFTAPISCENGTRCFTTLSALVFLQEQEHCRIRGHLLLTYKSVRVESVTVGLGKDFSLDIQVALSVLFVPQV